MESAKGPEPQPGKDDTEHFFDAARKQLADIDPEAIATELGDISTQAIAEEVSAKLEEERLAEAKMEHLLQEYAPKFDKAPRTAADATKDRILAWVGGVGISAGIALESIDRKDGFLASFLGMIGASALLTLAGRRLQRQTVSLPHHPKYRRG